jgi:hypothetical protein
VKRARVEAHLGLFSAGEQAFSGVRRARRPEKSGDPRDERWNTFADAMS